MGFSPGDFKCEVNGTVHWEQRGSRVVLWDDKESRAIAQFEGENLNLAATQLSLLNDMARGDE